MALYLRCEMGYEWGKDGIGDNDLDERKRER